MKRFTTALCLTFALLVGSVGVSWSADLLKGIKAYESGDYVTALRECTALAEQGNATCQALLGGMYQHGKGVPQNYKTALKWYRRAAEQGVADAQYNLGEIYHKGHGVRQDYKTAVKWYRRAAEKGLGAAQSNLGVMYGMGNGVIQDNVYAHMWGNLGASNGNENGGKLRDFLAKRMTPSQIAEAQKLARECVAKKYKGC